ncbi:MAG: WD40 repeat domain-containing serine/threonine protein kinase [Anaerolineales bacterium]
MQPEKIGRYEIKSELGRGGMATVYHGYDPRFEREVAVKVLPPELLHADPQFRLRFDREAKIIAQLEHPSIVPVYDVGEENNQPYFVMRYMGGGSLTDRIKASTFTVEQATKILEQIAPGLDEAHSKGIIHRDFKPSNILFDNKGVPYISDFGIAKITQSANTMTGSAIVGTPAYMAPEQAQGTAIDGRADIYALGIILYEMLTGKQPYEADTPMGVAIKHITDPVPHILDANPNLPYEIEEIIQKAMAKDRDDRYSTAHEMVDALREVARDIAAGKTTAKRTAIKKSPTVPKATVAKQKQPEKKLFNVWTVIIPLLVVGIGGGFFLLNGNSSLFGKEPTATLANTFTPEATLTSQPTLEPTSTETAVAETFTPAPPTETLEPTIPPLPVVGGADKIAFIKKNDIWIMNIDGSDLRSLTVDHAAKFDLQWLPDGKTLLFISGKTVKTINTETRVEENITSFASADYFEAFNVSPDGTKVAISLQRELHIVPFDLEQMKNIKKRSDLIALKGCFYDVDLIKAATMDVLWSKDMQKVAIKYLAVAGHAQSETIRVLDIHLCNEGSLPLKMDEFPGTRFAFKTNIMSIDWNGDELFLLNSNERNGGFGNLYLYNTVTHQAYSKLNVVGACCYRDARFSPDGNYVIFAYQDNSILDGPIELYYMPAGSLTTPGNYKPIENLPEDFFEDGRKESPQPALRPAK